MAMSSTRIRGGRVIWIATILAACAQDAVAEQYSILTPKLTEEEVLQFETRAVEGDAFATDVSLYARLSGFGVKCDLKSMRKWTKHGVKLNAPVSLYYEARGLDGSATGDIRYDPEAAKKLYKQCISLLQPKADAGDAGAMFFLARANMYLKEFDKAERWIKTASDRGYRNATGRYGIWLIDGDLDGKKDIARGAAMARKAADAGYPIFIANMGWMHDYGHGVRKDARVAVEWYKKAAASGNFYAIFRLGNSYHVGGNNLSKDYAEAMKWLRKGAGQEDPLIQKTIGHFYAAGHGMPRNYAKAREWYVKSAKQGYKDAQYELAKLYYYGRGVKRNKRKAVEYYKLAAERDHRQAQAELGVRYINGDGIKRNWKEAVRWYERSAENGYTWAMTTLGGTYIYGMGGAPKDETLALKWHKLAAEKGDRLGQFRMGLHYLLGIGVEKDEKKAFTFIKTSALRGYSRSILHLGRAYYLGLGVEKDYNQTFFWFQRGVSRGDKSSYYFAGLCNELGHGTAKNGAAAMKSYMKIVKPVMANRFGAHRFPCSRDAMYRVGVLHEQGLGTPQDKDKAIHWYTEASKYGDPDADNALRRLGRDPDAIKPPPGDFTDDVF